MAGYDTYLNIGGQPVDDELVFAFNVSPTVVEGDPITLALSQQGNAPGSVDGYSFVFDCGDGTADAPFSEQPSISCPTTDDGDRTVKGTVRNPEGQEAEFTAKVSVKNVVPALGDPGDQIVELGDPTVIELGSFIDPGADSPWAISVDWGDGTPATSFDVSEAGSLGTQEHTYADEGAYTVTVTVTDKDGGAGLFTFTVATRGQSEVQGSLTVHSLDADEEPLRGACFEVYEDAGNGALGNLVALICDGEDDEDDGTIVFAGLATGDYVLIESAAPAGFAKTEAVTFAIVGEESEVIVVRHGQKPAH